MTALCLALIAAATYMVTSDHTRFSASAANRRGLRDPIWIRFTLAAPLAALIYATFSSGELWQTLPVVAFGALIGSAIILVLLHDLVFVARNLTNRLRPISAAKHLVAKFSPRQPTRSRLTH